MFCPTSIIGLRFGKEGLYCLLYEQPKNKNTYPLCKKHTHYIMPQSFAETLIKEKETELHNMNLGKYTFIFHADKDLEITLVIVVDDIKKDQANAKRIIDAILKIFKEKRVEVKNFEGNLEEIKDIQQKLDEIVKRETLDKRAIQALWE